jgi:hypothetical protein
MDFMDRFRNVKETIRVTISDSVAHDMIFNMYDKLNFIHVKRNILGDGLNGVKRKIDIIPRREILSISYKLFDGELKFNKQRMKLLSSSERLFIIESILKELE